MKKLSLVLALIFVLTCALVACGGDENTSSEASKEATSEAAASSESATSSEAASSEEATSEEATSEEDVTVSNVETSQEEESKEESKEPVTSTASIVGKWQTELDMGDMLAASMGAEAGSISFKVNLILGFEEDNKATLQFKAITTAEELTNTLLKAVYDAAVAEGETMTYEEFVAAIGKDDMVASMQELITGLESETENGEYTYEDGKLSFEDVAMEINLSNDEFVVTKVEASEEDADMVPYFENATFKKVQ